MEFARERTFDGRGSAATVAERLGVACRVPRVLPR